MCSEAKGGVSRRGGTTGSKEFIAAIEGVSVLGVYYTHGLCNLAARSIRNVGKRTRDRRMQCARTWVEQLKWKRRRRGGCI
jgi:hypothetical protein